MKYYKGSYKPINPKKYAGNVNNITYRSMWECKFFMWCDDNRRVIQWASEEIIIPYYHKLDRKMRRYYTDALIKYRLDDDTIINYLIEIKPHKQTIRPTPPKTITTKTKTKYLKESLIYEKNSDKWTTAMAYAEKHNMKFMILTERNSFVKF